MTSALRRTPEQESTLADERNVQEARAAAVWWKVGDMSRIEAGSLLDLLKQITNSGSRRDP